MGRKRCCKEGEGGWGLWGSECEQRQSRMLNTNMHSHRGREGHPKAPRRRQRGSIVTYTLRVRC